MHNWLTYILGGIRTESKTEAHTFEKTVIANVKGEEVDLLPLAEDAIRRLGLLNTDQAVWLAESNSERFNEWSANIALAMRKQGVMLNARERKELGLGRAMMSRSTWERIDHEDTVNLVTRLETICTRIAIHAFKIADIQKYRREGTAAFGSQDKRLIITHDDHWGPPCSTVCKHHLIGKRLLPKQVPNFPLEACSSAVCRCHFKAAWLEDR